MDKGQVSETYQLSNAEAARMWTDPAFKATQAALREQLIADWENTKPDEPEQRERLYWQLCALRDITGVVAEGALQDQIDKENEEA